MALLCQNAIAACNPRDIKEQANGTFVYPVECHVEFGRLIQVEKERKKQIEHLKESIKLKDLAIDTSNARIQNWQTATYKVEDRLLKIERNNDRMKWVYFGLGIIVMSGAVYTAKQLK